MVIHQNRVFGTRVKYPGTTKLILHFTHKYKSLLLSTKLNTQVQVSFPEELLQRSFRSLFQTFLYPNSTGYTGNICGNTSDARNYVGTGCVSCSCSSGFA